MIEALLKSMGLKAEDVQAMWAQQQRLQADAAFTAERLRHVPAAMQGWRAYFDYRFDRIERMLVEVGCKPLPAPGSEILPAVADGE